MLGPGEGLGRGQERKEPADLEKSCFDSCLFPRLARRRGGGGSLRAFRRARDGEAKGRVDWKRSRWPDAKFEVTGAKCDLRKEQQREKREDSREIRGKKAERD